MNTIQIDFFIYIWTNLSICKPVNTNRYLYVYVHDSR